MSNSEYRKCALFTLTRENLILEITGRQSNHTRS